MYSWRCSQCEKQIEVIRSFADYQQEPGLSPDDGLEETECSHKWERLIGGNQTLYRGRNWGPGKGFWLAACALGGLLLHSNLGGYWII